MKVFEYSMSHKTAYLLSMLEKLGVIHGYHEVWGTVGRDEIGVQITVKI